MIRTDQMMKITDTINDLKAKCIDIQSSLQSTNKAFQILRHRYQTLRDFMSQRKLDIVKEFRDDPLWVVGDSHRNEIVLGQGRFGVCKLTCMSFSVSGKSLEVAIKYYTESTT